jgi:hypothetical protein
VDDDDNANYAQAKYLYDMKVNNGNYKGNSDMTREVKICIGYG